MSRKPTHNVQLISTIDGVQWPFVGAAWENRDKSITIVLDVDLPQGARIHLRKRKAESTKALMKTPKTRKRRRPAQGF